MYPFNQGGGSELSFQAAGNPEEEEEDDRARDLNLDNELLAAVNLYTTTSSASTTITFSSTRAPTTAHLTLPAPADRGRGQARRPRAQGDSTGGGGEGFDEDHDKRKMQHRDIERQRRQEMSSLFSNLRSLLPHQYLEGKRSMSDHIDESANYIKNLQGRIKALGDARDRLTTLRQHESSTTTHGSRGSHPPTTTIASSDTIPNNVEVSMGSGGLHVQISSGQREDGPRLSTALKVLLEAGLNVASCVTNKMNGGGLLHNIYCELVTNMGQGEIDVQQLQQRLYQVVCSNTSPTQL